ncbi:NAD(P)H-hydrate dehydratase [Reichenbachiella agarivorans]|uniref:Bifunctional NAD(P)H-hydrate repair enzyme n=1 Tax=Reichenbachiella agarivorans TaxID=2979464 RepID=A0ABY6CTZ7_9BACT|nr:NAD(P)H-hydrate dehydratase [Reichenbachiella agarivorans]UXP32848.1 NAD(P)H-hydrate dehydratase [Reichenbachiella agarivorans]
MNLNLCLKILDAKQIRQADLRTIQSEPIASIDLMERASEAFVTLFVAKYRVDRPVKVFCGTGNNGGDGLAIARMLLAYNYQVEVYIIGDPDQGSPDFAINYRFVQTQLTPRSLTDSASFPVLESKDLVIDAIFGSGLSRPIIGFYGELIEYINQSDAKEVVAVDIASGLGCSQTFIGGSVMQVTRTITFQSPKLSQLLPSHATFTGELKIVDIGLDWQFIAGLPSDSYFLTRCFIQSILRTRGKYIHKGEAGRCLIVAGSHGMMGAAVLSAKACMRSGTGLLTMCVPRCGVDIVQVSVPEVLVITSDGDERMEGYVAIDSFDAIGIGPGIGTDASTAETLLSVLQSSNQPMVLDADALNILSQNPSWLEFIPKDSVLTPHPGEFKRLVGQWQDDYHRLDLQKALAKQYSIYVLVKGAHTTIACPDGTVFFNSTGNPGMATAGSGDVLTGMITSFLGQGYSSLEAVLIACYVHGLAGDIYARTHAEQSLIASDIIDNISFSLRSIPENR